MNKLLVLIYKVYNTWETDSQQYLMGGTGRQCLSKQQECNIFHWENQN